MHIGVCLFMFHCVCLYCADVSCRVWGGGVMKKDGGGGDLVNLLQSNDKLLHKITHFVYSECFQQILRGFVRQERENQGRLFFK